MKLLYHNLQLGSFDGSNAHAQGMLQALRAIYGEENIAVANDPTPVLYNHGRDTLRKKLGPALDPVRIARKRRFTKIETERELAKVNRIGFKPDVLLARSTPYDETPLRLADALGCKLVLETNTPFQYEQCDLRNISMRPLVRSFEAKMLKRADGIYAVSQELIDLLELQYGGVAKKSQVVPNGFSQELYEGVDREMIRARVREDENVADAFVVSFVGSLQEWHGIPRLLEIADAMQGDKSICFWVLGDGVLRERVEHYAANHANLTWRGNVSQERMRDLLIASDLGIMPYNQMEHFYFSPLKMYDMVGAELPFLGSKIGQVSSFCASLQCGSDFASLAQDAAACVERIFVVKNDRELLSAMRSDLRDARLTCTWDCRARTLAGWIEEVVDGAVG